MTSGGTYTGKKGLSCNLEGNCKTSSLIKYHFILNKAKLFIVPRTVMQLMNKITQCVKSMTIIQFSINKNTVNNTINKSTIDFNAELRDYVI